MVIILVSKRLKVEPSRLKKSGGGTIIGPGAGPFAAAGKSGMSGQDRYRRIISFLFGALALLAGCSAGPGTDRWLGSDKPLHFSAAATVAAASTSLARGRGFSRDESAAAALGLALSVGSAKEAWDRSRGGRWSWKDMAWNLAGAVAGVLAASAAE